jgi:alpha-D-glucose phosphate-specific phosphoglucomutase
MGIEFGTSGWRALIAEDFTFDNVRLLSQAVANYLKKTKGSKAKIVIAHDVRFLSEEFSYAAAAVIASNDIDVYLPKRSTPTPVASFTIIEKKLQGGIIISASHNGPEYNGFKFSSEHGGPSPKEITSGIEKELSRISGKDIKFDEQKINRRITSFNPAPSYLKHLERILDTELLKKHKFKIAVDCMNGIATGYLDKMLEKLNYRLKVINKEDDPLFGGRDPDPLPGNLKELIKIVKEGNFDLGLSVDGDSDRFGIIDRGGDFIYPNQVISLIFYYLVKARKRFPKVARSVSTTHLVDEIAKDHKIEVVETPIGFKYISELLATGEYIMGAEESGGLSIGGHLPEKDGILVDLLVVEALAYFKKPAKEILKEIYKKYGRFYNKRINLEVEKDGQKKFMDKISKNPPTEIAGARVEQIDKVDGYKFILDNGDWLMFRASGTEPVIRCYLESRTSSGFKKLEKEAISKIKSSSIKT